jgi:hypothetical protein
VLSWSRHPRWSQAEETPLGGSTQGADGAVQFVADLYKGLESEPLFM